MAGFTATFLPKSPVTIPFTSGSASGSGLKVALTNTFSAPTHTVTPSSSVATSSSAVTTVPPSASSSSPPLATTGPHEQIRASLWVGVGLFGLSLILLFEGRVRRLAKHRT